MGQGTIDCYGECCFRVIYCEWYGVYDFLVLSVVEIYADYDGVNVFHVCLNFDVAYGVGGVVSNKHRLR